MAGTKITALTEDTTPASTDILAGVKDPGGTPLNRKLTYATIFDTFRPRGHAGIAYKAQSGQLPVSPDTVAMASALTYYTVDIFDTDESDENCVSDAAGSRIRLVPGTYDLGGSVTVSVTTGNLSLFVILFDGTNYYHAHRGTKFLSSTSEIAQIVIVGPPVVLTATPYTDIYMLIGCQGAGQTASIYSANLFARRVA